MSIFYDCVTGAPQRQVSSLRRRISAFTRQGKIAGFKIGITNDPERRWRQAYNNVYDEMLVLYVSYLSTHVLELERELVSHNQGFSDNLIAGGGGRTGRGMYFLYIVIKHKTPLRKQAY